MTLRIDAAADGVDLTLPRWVSLTEGLRFAESKKPWLERRLGDMPARTPFADGAIVPILGESCRILHRPEALPLVWRRRREIHVGGPENGLAARLSLWLREEAAAEIRVRVRAKSAILDRSVPPVVVRDTSSLWGSCSSSGRLSFCWRLIMAPEPVLDYVVAHEVAHLRHHNHGPRFWALVGELTKDAEGCRAWLRQEGARLHRYG
ncbi:MAG: SprT family zinc-dependent metalloprotease [Alphaproteobacteria bacterium]